MMIAPGLWWEGAGGQPSPHQVFNLSWVIGNIETGWTQTLANGVHSPGTWWPTLTFDLCQLAKDSWERTERSPRNSYPPCRHSSWYICPGGKRTAQCGGPETFYCARWGCETYTNGYWKAKGGDLVTFTDPTPGESRIQIKFTDTGKRHDWKSGVRWGLRLYTPGQTNPGLLFSLQLVQERITPAVGLNLVLQDQKPPSLLAPARPPVLPRVTQAPGNVSVTPYSTAGGSAARPLNHQAQATG